MNGWEKKKKREKGDKLNEISINKNKNASRLLAKIKIKLYLSKQLPTLDGFFRSFIN